MTETIELGEITIVVTRKDIKNVHLSVHPPTGHVRISAPKRMKVDTIRVFAVSRLGWIKEQQKKLREQERETPHGEGLHAGILLAACVEVLEALDAAEIRARTSCPPASCANMPACTRR